MLRPTNTYSGLPRGLGHLPKPVREFADRCGGIVSTGELRALEVYPTMLELYRDYAALQAVRQGWHCLPSVPDVLRLAWRFGGPLACVSALAFHDAQARGTTISGAVIAQPLHVCLPRNTARVPSAALLARRWGILEPLQPVIHWSTTTARSGDRRAVSRDEALRQADRCDRLDSSEKHNWFDGLDPRTGSSRRAAHSL